MRRMVDFLLTLLFHFPFIFPYYLFTSSVVSFGGTSDGRHGFHIVSEKQKLIRITCIYAF